MYKEILNKYIQYFNNGDIEKVNELYHEDAQLIRLMTNDVLYNGKTQMEQMNYHYMKEMDVQIKLLNMLEFNNIVIMFSEIIGIDAERITVTEMKDGKIYRVWASQFKKEKEE